MMLVSALMSCCSANMKSRFHNWSDVRVFLAVFRAGSTLAASKDLNMTQPTVARRIDALEQALGVTLFKRDTRGFKPTPAARDLLPTAEAIATAAGQFSDAATKLTASRAIGITATEATFSTRFSAILEDFMGSYGEVRFDFVPSNQKVDLAGGAADVAIRFAHAIDDPSLICRKIAALPTSLFASQSYAAKNTLPTSEHDLKGHKFIVFDGATLSRVTDWLLPRIDPAQIVMTCNDLKSAETAVRMGTGIAGLPIGYSKKNDAFVKCFDLPPETGSSCWLLVSPTAHKRPAVKAFVAFFAARYAALFQRK